MNESTLEQRLQPDIDNFESRYRYLLRTTLFLYEKKFHLIATVFMSMLILFLALFENHFWYSYILSVLTLGACWYAFFLTNKLRDATKEVPKDELMLVQMNLRKDVLKKLSALRFFSFIYTALIFITLWSFRSSEKRFDKTGIIVYSLVLVFIIASTFVYSKRMKTTRIYLENIIAILEAK